MLALLLLLLLGFFLFSPRIAAANTASIVFYVEDISKTKPFDFSKVQPPTPAVVLRIPPQPKKRVPSGRNYSVRYCSCVLAVKAWTGYSQSVGAARYWPKNTNTPTVGGVVITNESSAGHVGYILVVNNDTFTFKEWNYVGCSYTERTFSIYDKRIIGFWSPQTL